MKIGLLRHAKVKYQSPRFSNGSLFSQSLIDYQAAEIDPLTLKISRKEFPVCYASNLLRAIETAKLVRGSDYQTTADIVEIPNFALLLLNMKLPTNLRAALGRIAWFINCKSMPETRSQSNLRARKFLSQLLESTNEDTLLITHGFFMQSLRHELRRVGFRGHCPYAPVNGKLYVFKRD